MPGEMDIMITTQLNKCFTLALGLLLMIASPSMSHAEQKTAHNREELVDFVKKAVDYIKQNGKESAFKQFSNKTDTLFHDGELYIYVYDYQGKCLAHGTRPTLIGQNGFDVKDPDGNYPNRGLAEVAKKDKKGFHQFKWSNPVRNRVENKLGYVEDVNGEFFVGSGIYP